MGQIFTFYRKPTATIAYPLFCLCSRYACGHRERGGGMRMTRSKVKCLILYQMDPLGGKIGGIETFDRNFIKYAPEDLDIEFVGVSSDKRCRIGRWQEAELYGKRFNFLPVLYVKDENVRTPIPLSVKFVLSLYKHKAEIPLENKILMFHRVEHSIPFKRCPNRKFLIVHGHMKDLYNPYSEVRWHQFPWLYFKLEAALIPHINRIFVVRRDAVEFYKKRYPASAARFGFLPTWVDEDLFYPLTENQCGHGREDFARQEGLTPQNKLILFVGRLEGQKDPLRLIDSFDYVYSRDSMARLIIVGTGALLEKTQKKVKQKGLGHAVRLLGSLPQEKVAHLMKICDAFLLTSAFEGMPRSVLEALACGLPVVTTDVGEVGLVVKEGFSGKVVDRDIKEIGTAVLEVLNDRPKFSPENCLKSVEQYRAENVLTQVYSYCHEIAWADK